MEKAERQGTTFNQNQTRQCLCWKHHRCEAKEKKQANFAIRKKGGGTPGKEWAEWDF